MAEKSKKAPGQAETTKVTRIKAVDTKVKPVKTSKVKTEKPKKVQKKSSGFLKPFISLGGYFVGAWHELREVRWPTRSATWSLTFAVIAFSAFFAVLILLLDALYKYLFEIILK